MTSSWKKGAISGLIAGIIVGLMMEITIPLTILLGFYETWSHTIITGNIVVNVSMFGFLGMILGIIYSKVYSLIPRKGVLKYLIYGLFLYFIIDIKINMYLIPYGQILDIAGDLFRAFFEWIIFGVLLGILYEFLSKRHYPIKEEIKLITYPMKSGLLPGAIAGLCGGISAGVFAVIGHVTGYYGVVYEPSGEVISTITFWVSQFGHHVLINMIWGTIFGGFFALVYNLVPGKKIIKGVYYGLIMFAITTFQITVWYMLWLANHNHWSLAISYFLGLSIGGSNYLIFGLVLGYLYRKPSE